jgi:hypothetical protein
LIASDAAVITVRLLKTSPVNALLNALYTAQSAYSKIWGSNVITVTDTARNDYTVAQKCAFKKKPTITYAKEGGMMEWTFDCESVISILGAG